MRFLFAFLLSTTAHAEYRAFELVILEPKTNQTSVVLSNLDPRQYRHYYPVSAEARISYRATWMCKGNTSFYQMICPNPKAGASALKPI